MKLADILSPDLVIPLLAGQQKDEVLWTLASVIARHELTIDPADLNRALQSREGVASTGLGDGVAIPHARMPGMTRTLAAFGRSVAGAEFASVDGKPTHFFFALVTPAESAGTHLKALARVSRVLSDPRFRARLMRAEDGPALFSLLCEADERFHRSLSAA